jgi:hypothetical protein
VVVGRPPRWPIMQFGNSGGKNEYVELLNKYHSRSPKQESPGYRVMPTKANYRLYCAHKAFFPPGNKYGDCGLIDLPTVFLDASEVGCAALGATIHKLQ